MNNKVNNTRKNVRLSEESFNDFEKIKEKLGLKTDSAVLTYLINSYKERDELAKIVSAEIEKKFKNTFDRIRLASAFSEKYSYTILDAINTLLYEFNNVQVLYPASGDTKHKVVRTSMQNLKNIIEEKKQIKDDREKKKEKKENREG